MAGVYLDFLMRGVDDRRMHRSVKFLYTTPKIILIYCKLALFCSRTEVVLYAVPKDLGE